ncbi:hypothetical protein G6F37_007555 [Rhizopus arrhizus]|nr:hypothetical protein G6F38_007752 [Rhizopus arrhizus]KAG1156495.1 hypothetical protein G6F37_007555 [Rhizopus arrhizus]
MSHLNSNQIDIQTFLNTIEQLKYEQQQAEARFNNNIDNSLWHQPAQGQYLKTAYSHVASNGGYKDKKHLLDFYSHFPLIKTSIISIFQIKPEFPLPSFASACKFCGFVDSQRL